MSSDAVWDEGLRPLLCRYAPLVSRQHGKAPRVAWTAFHNVQLAPPGLPHVRSSRGFAVERSQSEGAQAAPPHEPPEPHCICQPLDEELMISASACSFASWLRCCSHCRQLDTHSGPQGSA